MNTSHAHRLLLACLVLWVSVAIPGARAATLEVTAVNDARDPLEYIPGETLAILVRLTSLAPGDEKTAFVRIYHPTEDREIKAWPIRQAIWGAAGAPLAAGSHSRFFVRAYVGKKARLYLRLESLRATLRSNRAVLRTKLPSGAGALSRLTDTIDSTTARLDSLLESPSLSRVLEVAATADSGLRFWGGGALRLVAVSSTDQHELLGRLTADPARIEVRVEDAATGQRVAGVPVVHEVISGEGSYKSAPGLSWTTNRSGQGGSYFVPDSPLAKIRVSLPGEPEKSITYTVIGEPARLTWLEPDALLAQPYRSALPLAVRVTDHAGAAMTNEEVRFRIVDAGGTPVAAPEKLAAFMTTVNNTRTQSGSGLGTVSIAATTLVILDTAPLGTFYVQAYLPDFPSIEDLRKPVAITRPVKVLAFDSQEEKVITGQAQRARGGQSTAQPMVAKFIGKPDIDPDTGAKIWPSLKFTILSGEGHLSLSASSTTGPESLSVQITEKDKLLAKVFYTPGSPHHHPALISVETDRKPQPPGVVLPGFLTVGTVFFTTRPVGANLVRPVFKRDDLGLYLRHKKTGQPQEEGEKKQEHLQPAEPIDKPQYLYQVDVLSEDGKAIEPDHKGKVMVELRVPAGLFPPEKVVVRSLDFAGRLVPKGVGAAPVEIEVELLEKPVRIEYDSTVYRSQPFLVTGDLLEDSGTLVTITPDNKYKLIYAPHKGFVQIGYAASPKKWLKRFKVLARMVIVLAIDGLGQSGWNRYVASVRTEEGREQFGTSKQLLSIIFARGIGANPSVRNEAVFPTVTFLNWAAMFTGASPKELAIAGNEFLARSLTRLPGKYRAWRHVNFTGGALIKPRVIASFNISAEGDLVRSVSKEALADQLLGTAVRTVYQDLTDLRKKPKFRDRKRAWVTTTPYTRGIDRKTDWFDPGSVDNGVNWFLLGAGVGKLLDEDATTWVNNKLNTDLKTAELITLYLPGLDKELHALKQKKISVKDATAVYLAQTVNRLFTSVWKTLARHDFGNLAVFILCSDHGHTRATSLDVRTHGITLKDIKPALDANGFTLVMSDSELDAKSGQITAAIDKKEYAFVAHNGPVAMVYLGSKKKSGRSGNDGFDADKVAGLGSTLSRRYKVAASIRKTLKGKIDEQFIVIRDPKAAIWGSYALVTNAEKEEAEPAGSTLMRNIILKRNKRDINATSVNWRLSLLDPDNAGELILHSRWDKDVPVGDRTQFAARELKNIVLQMRGQKWSLFGSNHGSLQKSDSETPLVVSVPGIWAFQRKSKPRTALWEEVRKLLKRGTTNPDVARLIRLMQRLPTGK